MKGIDARLQALEAKRRAEQAQQVAVRQAVLNKIMARFSHDELNAFVSGYEKIKGNTARLLHDPAWVDAHLNATEQRVMRHIYQEAAPHYAYL